MCIGALLTFGPLVTLACIAFFEVKLPFLSFFHAACLSAMSIGVVTFVMGASLTNLQVDR